MARSGIVLISVTEVRRWALEQLARVLQEQIASSDGSELPRRDPPEILRVRTDRDLAGWVRGIATTLLESDGSRSSSWDIVDEAVTVLLRANDIDRVRTVLYETLTRLGAEDAIPKSSDDGYFKTSITASDATLETRQLPRVASSITSRVEFEAKNLRFLSIVMQMCASHRKDKRKIFSEADVLALEHAYSILDQYGRLPAAYSFIRTDEFRPYQTYLSFADPGDGHLSVTVRDSDLLKGLIVHIEHIDRENVSDKSVVEAYRVPPLRTAARVRLHVGVETPCTAFIGRPTLEGGSYKLGRLKAVHTIAGACTAMFALGVAECKVAMDALTAAEAVDFMQTVAGNVQRDPGRQRLSAAFNINTRLMDDRKIHAAPVTVDDKLAIAQLAIDLTVQGQFNKVTWDGAAEGPSKPILGKQLSTQQLLRLVHYAHERGLETYISAGMLPEHMYGAALVGVGGVGIGLKLHHLDEVTNRPGPIKPALVKAALEHRDQAAATIAGRAAAELARLDWDYSRSLLSKPVNVLRRDLFETLLGWHSSANPAAWSDQKLANGAADKTLAAPLEKRLSELVARVDSEYPRRQLTSAAEDPGTPRGLGERDSADASGDLDPLRLSAERAIENARLPDPNSTLSPTRVEEVRRALEIDDFDHLRRLLDVDGIYA